MIMLLIPFKLFQVVKFYLPTGLHRGFIKDLVYPVILSNVFPSINNPHTEAVIEDLVDSLLQITRIMLFR